MIELRCGATELVLAPEVGGGIAAWRFAGQDVMRPAPSGARDPLDLASFPLVPWSNRIRDGRFVFAGREVRVPPTHGDRRNTIHGQGWLRPWAVVEQSRTGVLLAYDHAPDAWPWAYRAEQRFELREDGFRVRLSVENRAGEAMPAGLGLHPYYPNTPGMRLQARLDGWWETDAAIMPVRYHAVDPADDWSAWLHAARTTDNVFAGWDGRAVLTWPERGLAVEMTTKDAGYMVVYAPADGSIAVAEPVTHPTDALNEAGLPGIRVLRTGERQVLDVDFRAQPLA